MRDLVRGRGELTDEGLSIRSIDDSARTGVLHRLRPGRYVDGRVWRGMSRTTRHAVLVADLVPEKAVVSHFSAAVLHGLLVPSGADLTRVHLTFPRSAGRAPTSNLNPHRAAIDPADIVEVDGIPVTSVARTVYDLARSEDQLLSVAVADDALARERCRRADFAATLDRAAGRPGSTLARQVMAFADPLATTEKQSVARVLMARAGLPTPALRVTIAHPRGWELGPFHFAFADQRTVAMVVDHANPEPVSLHRAGVEESLRQAGLAIAWIESEDLSGPDRLDRRLAAAFAMSGDSHHHRGRARLLPGVADSMLSTRYPW